MIGVILAAGSGSRLTRRMGRHSKVLLPVAGRPIIEHTIQAFLDVGVTQLAIVVGFGGAAVRRRLGATHRGLPIEYIHNPDYRMGNALSLNAARSFTGDEPFLLSMADHMVSTSLLSRVVGTERPGNLLAVDFTLSTRHLEEGTRVWVNSSGLITRIGKELSISNGIDAGVFRLTPAVYPALAEVIGEEQTEYQLSAAIRRMIELGHPLYACDVSGCFWQDVDTWEDLSLVREVLAGKGRWAQRRKD